MLAFLKSTVAAGVFAVAISAVAGSPAAAAGKFACEPGETYVMNVMVSSHPYWVPVFEGFKQAAKSLGCEAVFTGTPEYDITKQIASFEQELVKKPKGILLHPMQADPFIEPINKAIGSGVSVTTFAADSPKSKRTAYITSDNVAEAKFAADEIVKKLGAKGEYAVLENPGQSNHDLRVTALIDYMGRTYPEMKLVHVAGQPQSGRPVDTRGRLCRRRDGCGSRGKEEGPDFACRYHPGDAGAYQAGQYLHVRQSQSGRSGFHGFHEHLPGCPFGPD